MTLPFNPLRAAEIARQAMEPEATPTEQCSAAREDGYWTVQCAYVAGHSGEHLFSRGDASDEIRLKLLRDNRDQRETLLREMAEQLMAACDLVEKQARRITILVMDQRRQLPEDVLRDIADAHTDRDSLRASCEQLTRERDELLAAAKKVVSERLSKIKHARETAAMCKLERLVNGDSALSTTHQAETK